MIAWVGGDLVDFDTPSANSAGKKVLAIQYPITPDRSFWKFEIFYLQHGVTMIYDNVAFFKAARLREEILECAKEE